MDAIKMQGKCDTDAETLRSAIVRLLQETENDETLRRIFLILSRGK